MAVPAGGNNARSEFGYPSEFIRFGVVSRNYAGFVYNAFLSFDGFLTLQAESFPGTAAF